MGSRPSPEPKGEDVTDYTPYLFLIALIALCVQVYDVFIKQRVYQSRKTWNKLPNVHPYPDKHNNHAKRIRWLFYSVAISQTLFIVSVTVFGTVALLIFLFGFTPPWPFLVYALVVELVGVIAYRLAVRALTRSKRRYILGNIAVWMGFTGDEGEYETEEEDQ